MKRACSGLCNNGTSWLLVIIYSLNLIPFHLVAFTYYQYTISISSKHPFFSNWTPFCIFAVSTHVFMHKLKMHIKKAWLVTLLVSVLRTNTKISEDRMKTMLAQVESDLSLHNWYVCVCVSCIDPERRDTRASEHRDHSWTWFCRLPLLQPVHHEWVRHKHMHNKHTLYLGVF